MKFVPRYLEPAPLPTRADVTVSGDVAIAKTWLLSKGPVLTISAVIRWIRCVNGCVHRLVNGDAHIFVPIGLSDDELERMRAIALAEKEGKVKVEMRVRLTVEVPEGATEDDVHDVSVRIRTFLQHDFDDNEASIFGVGKVGYAYEALGEKEGR